MCIGSSWRQVRVRAPGTYSVCVLLRELTQLQPSRVRHSPRREPLPITTRWRPWIQPDPPQLIYLSPPKISFHFRSLAVTQPGPFHTQLGQAWCGRRNELGSPRGGAGVPLLGLREEGWESGSWVLAWGAFRGQDVRVLRRGDARFSP